MISSEEEARLLLNKWINERANVVALFSMAFPEHVGASKPGLVCKVSGRIAAMDSTGTFCLIPSDSDEMAPTAKTFVLISIAGCGFGYGTSTVPGLMQFLPKDWESTLLIVFPNATTVALFAIEDAQNQST